MRWVLGLVGTGIDGPSISVNIMEFDRPDCLDDIANLGLTLAEGKQLLARVQQEVVAAQVNSHAVLRPDCRSCNGRCHVKDWRPHRIATLFGEVRVRLPRFLCDGCGRTETGVSWPSHCRSTPALDQLRARLSALITYRVAADVQGLSRDWGACRPGNYLLRIVEHLKSAANHWPERPVVNRAADLEQEIGASPGPSHLLRLVHAPIGQKVRRTFDDRGPDT